MSLTVKLAKYEQIYQSLKNIQCKCTYIFKAKVRSLYLH